MNPVSNSKFAGIGLRQPHYEDFLNETPDISWVEVHTENFFAEGGASLNILRKVCENYPVSFHGVGLSIGSSDKLSIPHLKKIKKLIDEFNPFLVSEHLSWSSVNNIFMNDLLPLPYNEKTFNVIANKIDYIQNYLNREILIENPSTYINFNESNMDESIFLNNLAKKTNCGLLLDVNNLYVNSVNHNMDALQYLEQIENKFIKEMHLAGHYKLIEKNLLIDTHDNYVSNEVWDLYETVIKKHGYTPTLIEWDDNLPSLNELILEAKKSEIIANKYFKELSCVS